MASPAPGCCPKGSVGRVASPANYENQGKEVDLGSVKAYVVEPAERTGKGILVLHDIFGQDSGRTKMICDEYAAKGFSVVMPYLFHSGGISESLATPNKFRQALGLFSTVWFLRSYKWTDIGPILKGPVLSYMIETLGLENIGLMCFCWGCYPMMHLLGVQDEFPQIKGGVGFHPSIQVWMGLFQSSKPVLQAVSLPFAFLAAGADPDEIKPGKFVHNIVKDKPFADDCVFKLYPDMLHGWVNRGKLEDELVHRDYIDAIQVADTFFSKHL